MKTNLNRHSYYPILFLLFLISGFCGLLYQIVWLRLAFSSFGIITPVLSVIVSIFMLGLAVGSLAGGRYIKALTGRSGLPAIVFYALAEFFIGVGGLMVPKLFAFGQTILLPAGNFDSFRYLAFSAFILGSSILPWCICMGATVPFMMAFIKELNRDDIKGFSYLYLANVIGAMFGTIITAGFLIELLGFNRTLLVAASSNFFIAAVSIGLAFFRKYPAAGGITANTKTRAAETHAAVKFSPYSAILFMTGFVSMAMEVVWTRAFTPVLQTTIYAFASILAVYLLATWIGLWRYREQAAARHAMGIPRLMAFLSFFSFLPVIFSDPIVWRMTCIHNFKVSQAIFALASIFPFCAALGYLTPKLIDDLSQGNPKSAGRVYAINIFGCILGPLCAGYLLLPTLGVKFSLISLSIPFAGYLIYEIKKIWAKNRRYALSTTAALSILLISSVFLLSSYEESPSYRPGVVRRDYVATVISCGKGMEKRLLVNGIGMTNLTTITKIMAHVPLSVRGKKPESALIICFGMGTTFRSALTWGIKTTAVELVPSVRDAFGFYFSDADEILKNPNGMIVVDDGRRFLRRTSEKFDLITIDPPPPVEASGSGLLYSKEFYDVLKTRLKDGGILAQWYPGGEEKILKAVAKSIQASFPYVRAFRSIEGWGFHFFASMQPFDMPKIATFVRRVPIAAGEDLVEWTPEKSPAELYGTILERELPLEKILTPDVTFSVTDDRPFNEYFLVRRLSYGLQNRKK